MKSTQQFLAFVHLSACVCFFSSMAFGQWPEPDAKAVKSVLPRTSNVLPFEEFRFKGTVGRTVADSDPPEFPQPARPPKDASNIVFILIDDAGYGQFESFGGMIPTPALDRVAADGLRYTRFHTTALCTKVGEGRMERTQAITLGLGGTLDIGKAPAPPSMKPTRPPSASEEASAR